MPCTQFITIGKEEKKAKMKRTVLDTQVIIQQHSIITTTAATTIRDRALYCDTKELLKPDQLNFIYAF